MIDHKLSGRVWQHQGKSSWYFVTIAKSDVDEIKKEVIILRGFKSIKVEVQIDSTTWQTSIFPDKDGTYLLPIKKAVRKSENINAGDRITFYLKVI